MNKESKETDQLEKEIHFSSLKADEIMDNTHQKLNRDQGNKKEDLEGELFDLTGALEFLEEYPVTAYRLNQIAVSFLEMREQIDGLLRGQKYLASILDKDSPIEGLEITSTNYKDIN